MNNCEILLGHKAFFSRTVFQACAAKTVTINESKSTVSAMRLKFKNCIWAGIAYRTSRGEDFYEEISGIGKKILLLMLRMDISNITIGVSVWYSGSITSHDCKRMVLDRVMDMVNCVNSLLPPEHRENIIEKEHILIESDPISCSNYLEFPERPYPAPPPPFDYESDRLRRKLKEICSLFDVAEAKSLHELSNHTIIGKVLQLLYCLLTSIPFSQSRLKAFFKTEKIVQIMTDFEPNSITKRKIRELKKLLEQYSYLDPEVITKISYSSFLILEYVKNTVLLVEEVPLPKPFIRSSAVLTESVPEIDSKPLIYRSLSKPQRKQGSYLDTKEMIINDKYQIQPLKIKEKVAQISKINLSVDNLQNSDRSYAIERYSSVDAYPKLHRIGKNSMSNYLNGISKQSIQFSKISLGTSNKSIGMSKISIEMSKKSIQMSNKNLSYDEDLIDKAMRIKSHRMDSFGTLDTSAMEHENFRNINIQDIERQPTNVLLKFADILKDRRETHSLL